ncbi:MAG: hypothetical protein KGZ83_12270 [Sulfuricella sp.]|nr:hypothetical protein [Sulfuricella sp.]
MNRFLPFLALCAALSFHALPAAASSAPRNDAAMPTEIMMVLGSDFGLFRKGEGGALTFERANSFPLVPGQAYGWVIRLQTEKKTVKWREEFTLPVKPETWGDPADYVSISADGRTAVVEKVVELKDGAISNSWDMAPGDPKGKYVSRVWVEGQLIGTFEFEVR